MCHWTHSIQWRKNFLSSHHCSRTMTRPLIRNWRCWRYGSAAKHRFGEMCESQTHFRCMEAGTSIYVHVCSIVLLWHTYRICPVALQLNHASLAVVCGANTFLLLFILSHHSNWVMTSCLGGKKSRLWPNAWLLPWKENSKTYKLWGLFNAVY